MCSYKTLKETWVWPLDNSIIENYESINVINFIHIPKNGGTSIKDICKKCDKLIYNGHETDVFNSNLKNQFVILRHPIERFISAVYYTLEKWSHTDQVKYLIDNGINTPDKWVTIWKNTKHSEHKNLMKEMANLGQKDQRIGNKKHKYNWIYISQSEWFNNPKYIIIMDNLNEELKYFINRLGVSIQLEKKNSTNNKDYYLSEDNRNWLEEFYKKDLEIYNKFKMVKMTDRIPI